jgi:hypothetical protein
MDDVSLSRMSGIAIAAAPAQPRPRNEFWKREPEQTPAPVLSPPVDDRVELRIQLAPGITISLAVPDGIDLQPADVRALRAAAAPLIELAQRQLGSDTGGGAR